MIGGVTPPSTVTSSVGSRTMEILEAAAIAIVTAEGRDLRVDPRDDVTIVSSSTRPVGKKKNKKKSYSLL
jgi:hypothetical protein